MSSIWALSVFIINSLNILLSLFFSRYNLVMLGLSASFLLLSYWLTWMFGGVGFILANCCNMALRITHSIVYIRQYFLQSEYRPLWGLRPHSAVVVALGVSAVITAFSEVSYTVTCLKYVYMTKKSIKNCIKCIKNVVCTAS